MAANTKKFRILRGILSTLGLSKKSANDVVDWISNILDNEEEPIPTQSDAFTEYHPRTNQITRTKLPYMRRDAFMSSAELNFYRVLMHTLDGQAIVFIKVGLSDIFFVKSKDRSEYQTYLNKIDRKHVDFLLCDVNTLEPICGIELDDKSHARKDRQERDRFVDAVFEISNLPLIHIPVRRSYVTAELYDYICPYIPLEATSQLEPSTEETKAQSIEAQPGLCCPKCGSEMVLRTAKRGKNAGQEFWGCTNYPHCRAIIKVANQVS